MAYLDGIDYLLICYQLIHHFRKAREDDRAKVRTRIQFFMPSNEEAPDPILANKTTRGVNHPTTCALIMPKKCEDAFKKDQES